MTTKHRNRLLFATALVIVVLGVCVAPVFASQGPAVGCGVLALSAIFPALVLGVIAFVFYFGDKEDRRTRLTSNRWTAAK